MRVKDIWTNNLLTWILPRKDGDNRAIPLHRGARYTFRSSYKLSQPEQLEVQRQLRITWINIARNLQAALGELQAFGEETTFQRFKNGL